MVVTFHYYFGLWSKPEEMKGSWSYINWFWIVDSLPEQLPWMLASELILDCRFEQIAPQWIDPRGAPGTIVGSDWFLRHNFHGSAIRDQIGRRNLRQFILELIVTIWKLWTWIKPTNRSSSRTPPCWGKSLRIRLNTIKLFLNLLSFLAGTYSSCEWFYLRRSSVLRGILTSQWHKDIKITSYWPVWYVLDSLGISSISHGFKIIPW